MADSRHHGCCDHRRGVADGQPAVAEVAGDESFAATQPFLVEVIPSLLVAGLLPD
jgi:hypothetical protein